MAQKFIGLEEAAKQLGVSKDRLNQLREAGKVRGYRDGASWKFRGDDIDKLSSDGIPTIEPPPSDLTLESLEPLSSPSSGLDLDSADETTDAAAASDISLDDVDEPTVPVPAGEADDDALALDAGDDSISLSDSILLSEVEGTSTDRPPSTIIGKADLGLDADLNLAGEEVAASGPSSDVRLAPETSDIISAGDSGIALEMEPPSPSDNFEGLAEVEVDLEAESSRILSREEVDKASKAASKPAASKPAASKAAAAKSDLELAPSGSDAARAASDVGLGSEASSGAGLTGLSALELDDDDDDQVLGEGSDITLTSESSGINIISPSDSGLALDEVPLDMTGSSPIGSSLDLGSALGSSVASGIGIEAGESQIGEDFQLTPLGEETEEEEKDSSQVIALDEFTEEEAAAAPLAADIGDSGMLGDDFATVGLAPGAAGVVAEPVAETPFSGWNVAGLSGCVLLLALCGMVTFDLMRNIWSWDGVTTLNSSLLEVVNPFL